MTSRKLMNKYKEFGIQILYQGFHVHGTIKIRKWCLVIPYTHSIYRTPESYVTAIYGYIDCVQEEIENFINMFYNPYTKQLEMCKGVIV